MAAARYSSLTLFLWLPPKRKGQGREGKGNTVYGGAQQHEPPAEDNSIN
jgi:hypothetical protein